MLAVVEPQHVSISGGGVMLYKPLDGKAVHVDFREEAPALYHPQTFCRNATCLGDQMNPKRVYGSYILVGSYSSIR